MKFAKGRMEIITSELFKRFPEITFGFSTKIGIARQAPFYFNMSLTVGDNEPIVKENREAFFNQLGLLSANVAIQKQIHSDIITEVNHGGLIGESDGLITMEKGIGLAVSSADCVPIFIYDKQNEVIAGVHSGWRGTEKQILMKTLRLLESKYNSEPQNLFTYIGPSISQINYEVGTEFIERFDEKYILKSGGKLYLNVVQVNLDILSQFGLPESQIEISPLCSFEEKNLLHSFRRDGSLSGRSLGVIAMKGKI